MFLHNDTKNSKSADITAPKTTTSTATPNVPMATDDWRVSFAHVFFLTVDESCCLSTDKICFISSICSWTMASIVRFTVQPTIEHWHEPPMTLSENTYKHNYRKYKNKFNMNTTSTLHILSWALRPNIFPINVNHLQDHDLWNNNSMWSCNVKSEIFNYKMCAVHLNSVGMSKMVTLKHYLWVVSTKASTVLC